MSKKPQTGAEAIVLSDLIAGLDVDAAGVARIADWKGTKLEETAMKLLPQARSVVVLAMEIYPEILNLVKTGRMMGAASLNDLYDCNTQFISGRLTKAAYDIVRTSHSLGWKALPLPADGCPYDARFLEAVFSYRHAGQAAGLGKIGWHSLLITPQFGPRVRLAVCLTEAALEPTSTEMTLDCDSCGRCLEVCPAGALAKPAEGEQHALNKFACCSFRSAAGGCPVCMRACPVGG